MIVFEEEYYEKALIGVTTDERAVYSYELMVGCLMNGENMSYEEAVEWLEFNTVRAFIEGGPIIVKELEEEDYGKEAL